MALDKQFFQLEAPTLIEANECAAMIADDPKYYVAKDNPHDKTAPFSPIIDLIEWLNVKGKNGAKAAALKGRPIYYVGKQDPLPHELEMARQNNWTLVRFANKKPLEKQLAQLEMLKFKNKSERVDIPAKALAGDLAKFKLVNVAAGPAIVPTEKLQKLYMLTAFSLAAKKAQDRGRVAALIVTSGGEILSYGVKSSDNSILHAEVTAIQSLFVNNPARAAALSSEETYLFTTLKPCGMCAAMIKACGAGKIHVVFGQDDFGEGAANTCLDANPGMHHKLAADLNLKNEEKQTLLQQLDANRKGNSGGPIVHSLDEAGPKALMNLAHDRTLHKVAKYSASETDSDKKKVMAHVESFLKAVELIPA